MLVVHYLFGFPLLWYDLNKGKKDGRNEFGSSGSSLCVVPYRHHNMLRRLRSDLLNPKFGSQKSALL